VLHRPLPLIFLAYTPTRSLAFRETTSRERITHKIPVEAVFVPKP
jgi:hypothetical protein